MAEHAHDSHEAHGHDDLWRKNIPADFDGRHGRDWDDEIDIGIVYKSAVAVVVAVAVAFVFCWLLLEGLASFSDKPVLSPLAEANARHLPPTPQLAPLPEAELTALRAEVFTEVQEYGWADQAAGRVHIPVDKAIDLVLAGRKIDVELPTGQPVDVTAPPASSPAAPAVPPTGAPAHPVPGSPEHRSETDPHGGGH